MRSPLAVTFAVACACVRRSAAASTSRSQTARRSGEIRGDTGRYGGRYGGRCGEITACRLLQAALRALEPKGSLTTAEQALYLPTSPHISASLSPDLADHRRAGAPRVQ